MLRSQSSASRGSIEWLNIGGYSLTKSLMDTGLTLCWRAVFCSIRSSKRLVSRLLRSASSITSAREGGWGRFSSLAALASPCFGAAGLLRVLTILGKQDNDLNQDGKIWPRKCGM